MKRLALFLTLVFLLTMLPLPVFAYDHISTEDFTTLDDFGYSPESLYPFVYRLSDDWTFFREYIGPCDCEEGYLYVQDLTTKEIIQVLDVPVTNFTETEDSLYCIVGNKIIKTDYVGRTYTELFTSDSAISSLEFYNNKLYFLNGNDVTTYNLASNSTAVLLQDTTAAVVMPLPGNKLLLRESNEECSIYHIASRSYTVLTGENAVAEYLDVTNTFSQSVPQDSPPQADLNTVSLNNDITFPLTEYPAGSYFSYSATGCNHSANGNTQGKVYGCAYQCMGFAMYASDKFAHKLKSDVWASFDKPAGDTSSTSIRYDSFTSDSDVSVYFNALTEGSYIRLSAHSSTQDTNDPGTHSIVYVGLTSNYVQTYDANRDNRCGIKFERRTLYDMRTSYPYMYEHVSHHYTESAVSYTSTRHKIGCIFCTGYITQPHIFITQSSGSRVCKSCGYTAPTAG